MKEKKIVILGGGFGGIYTCKYLLKKLKNTKVKVVLINKSNYFVFTPMLHEVATGGLNAYSSIEPIREVLNAQNFRFIRCGVNKIDFNEKKIYTEEFSVTYDYLVISIGARTNYFNISGAEENTIPLKTIEDASRIRKRIVTSLENSLIVSDQDKLKQLLTFVIIGAGPTGVELAAEIEEFISQNLKYNFKINKDLIKIIMIQSGSKIMSHLSDEKIILLTKNKLESKGIKIIYNSKVTKVADNYLIINNKEKIYSNNIIWTAGVTPNIINTVPKISDEKNYFHVNKFLEVKNLKNVFALGDCALFYDEVKQQNAPALAQVASEQAKIASDNIVSLIDKNGHAI